MSEIAKINSFFDHIYVLTLKRAAERQAWIEQALGGFRWSFYYGVDKNDLTEEAVAKEGVYDDSLHRNTKRTHRSMRLGEVACALSHRGMYKDMLTNGYDNALILEDDVLPIHGNLWMFEDMVSELPENWELLMLGYYGERHPTLRYRFQTAFYLLCHHLRLFRWHKVSKEWIRDNCLSLYSDHLYRWGRLYGTHAYAVTRRAAEKFIRYQSPIILQADRVFGYYKATHGLEAYAARPKMFTLSELSNRSFIQPA